jgi:cysteinyl-tRNA synthetase
MSLKYLGDTLDIHGGGQDLIFPHHENEIAQSEAFTGGTFVNYWMHNGFVNVNREKMSKSLGNFFTIREILEKYDAEVVRFFLLSTHYRSPIDFSDQNLEEANRTLDRFYHLVGELKAGATGGQTSPQAGEGGGELVQAVSSLLERFRAAMDDDCNSAEALGEVFKTTRLLSGALARGEAPAPGTVEGFLDVRGRIGEVLGVLDSTPGDWNRRREEREEKARGTVDKDWIEEKLAERERARGGRNWVVADAIRDELLAKGITLEDTSEGTVWRLQKR